MGFVLAPAHVRAQISLPDELRPDYIPTITEGVTADDKITSYVGDLILTVMQVMGGIAIIFLIIAGLKYILAGGEEEQISKNKTTIFWILGGLILLILSYSIVKFVIKITLVTEEIK
jgi:hypothetical protein